MRVLLVFASFFIFSNLFAQVNLNSGLVAYYPFNGNANDISGNNNNPIFNNATLTNDRFGNLNGSYHFNGVNNYMRIPNSTSLNSGNTLSIACWIRVTGFYQGPCHGNRIVMKGNADYLTGNYLLGFDDNAFTNGQNCSNPIPDILHQNFFGLGSIQPPGYTPYVQQNQWMSVIYTNDGTTGKLYINCELKSSAPSQGLTFTNNDDLFLGRLYNNQYPYWLNGDLDELRIYNRALNIDEVNALGGCSRTSCTDWLKTQAVGQSVTVGDLDISGNQITVEATYNDNSVINPSTQFGKLVSKHTDASNVNYSLMPVTCEITTTNGYVNTPSVCLPTKDRIYHVAMVYNGSVLKFYRNGFLLSSIPWSGNLINNDFLTTIAYGPNNPGSAFQQLGYVNEVRIWNVARTQAQLQTYMNSSLPTPTTQVGLKGYYTFDNLLNKQGNAAFNGTINGGATINATNPNCNFVADSCNVINTACKGVITLHGDDCVRLPLNQSYYSNTGFTWETWFNSSWYENNDNSLRLGQSLIISEDAVLCEDIQLGFGWVNIPRNSIGFVVDGPGGCGSRDNNPCFFRPPGGFISNTWYHVAGVRNFATNQTLLYLNGQLVDSKTNTLNPFNRNILTRIGTYVVSTDSGFAGKMDEIRFWKTARTSTEILANYNKCLAGTEVGLTAYYRANQNTGQILKSAGGVPLLNGILDPTINWNTSLNAPLTSTCFSSSTSNTNATICQGQNYNGHTATGNYIDTLININGCDSFATINLTVNNCSTNIINDYTSILSLDPCKNILTVGNASAYNIGDTVLLIQMKGAIIDSTNTAAFGTITDYKSAGNYEYNYVKSKTGNQIELKNKTLRTYEIPNGKVQLIRVPYYQNYSTTNTLTCLPWDGTVGGVLVFNVANTITLNNNIDVSGKGFKGGNSLNQFNTSLTCFNNDFTYPFGTINAAAKGESIYNIGNTKSHGKGSNANGGGGGLGHNSGGGGGSNGGLGGFGGYQLVDCGSAPFDNRGIGGKILTYSNAANKIFLGGGGGSGHTDNAGGIDMKGGNGGGIVIIGANNLDAANFKILSKGDSGQVCNNNTNNCHDGNGGGGAAGTILLSINNYTSNTRIEAVGGKGADLVIFNGTGANQVGPGGGGSGGITWLKSPTLPANVVSTLTGGLSGVIVQNANNPWGATSGQAGQTLFNLNLPISSITFKANIDSVRFNALSTSCQAFNFNGLGFTNTNPIVTWQWYFGDNATGTGQNVSHTYSTANTFTVKLVVTDINGCKDSITRNIITNTLTVDAGVDSTFCGSKTGFQLLGTTAASGALSYAWTSIPATTISNTSIINPTVNVNSTTTFYFTVSNSTGCSGTDSIKVIINQIPIVQTQNDMSICKRKTLQLATTLGLNTYQWSPGTYVSDSTISNPIFIDTIPRMLIVTGSNGFCSAKDTINIGIKPLPIVKTIKDTLICSTQQINLITTGAVNYSWTPSTFLSSTMISNPTFNGNLGYTYYVTGMAINGCEAKDTVVINVNIPNSFISPPNKSFCKNESVMLDGFNGNNVTYSWQPPTNLSNTTIINPIANPASTTPYDVNIIDPVCNYSKTFTVLVTVNPLPLISTTKSNDITCSNNNAKLNASGAVNYTWTPSPTLSSTTISNPIATPTNTTEYNVTGIDINGCKNSDKITVLVSLGNNSFSLPNTFTPNGDAKNECFGIKNWGIAQNVYFIIYNRWGEKVFETNSSNNCWNGKYKGEPAGQGNYVYYINAKTSCGDIVRKGNVLLIR